MTNRDLLKYMLVGIAWWLWENWWKVLAVVGVGVALVLLLTGCYVGILDPTPWATNTHTPTQTPTDEPTPTQEVTLEATFTACVSGSYAVAKWEGFTLYEFPNLTGDTIILDESNLLGYYPYQGEWLPITVVLLIEKDATFGTWYVVTGEGNPVYGWISPDVLSDDCQY